MVTRRQVFPIAAALGLLATTGLPDGAARADSGPQAVVDHALGTLQDLRHDKEFGNALQLISRAHAILIAPQIFKAGFFFGLLHRRLGQLRPSNRGAGI